MHAYRSTSCFWAGEIAHDEHGINELCSTLLAAGVIRVAIERPDGALTRGRGELMGLRRSLVNQLRAELERCWPGVIRAFRDLHRPIVLAFLDRWPTAKDAAQLTERQLATFLTKQHYSGRRDPTQLLDQLRSAPTGRAGDAETDARRQIIRGLTTSLGPIVEQIALLERQIAGAVRAHPDGENFLSPFKRAESTLTAAVLLAEIGDVRARYPTGETLAGDARQAAVAVESGKKKVATFRRACDSRLRNAFCTLADTSRHHNPWAHRLYADARARGHDHQRAIRTVGRAWSRVLWRCWQDGTPYDPARHNALQRQLLTTGGDTGRLTVPPAVPPRETRRSEGLSTPSGLVGPKD